MSFGKGRASRRWPPETYRPVPKRKNVPRRHENGGRNKWRVFAGVNGKRGLYVFVRQLSLTKLPGKMPLKICHLINRVRACHETE
jgi:hypothetical protein